MNKKRKTNQEEMSISGEGLTKTERTKGEFTGEGRAERRQNQTETTSEKYKTTARTELIQTEHKS